MISLDAEIGLGQRQGMSSRNEELLWVLLWVADMAMRPTFRNLTDSFESWSFRNGLHRRLSALERDGLLEREAAAVDALYRVTERGRARAFGGCDPEAEWNRSWDGTWRIALFDIPESRRGVRSRVRRILRERRFGYLQNSVWVSPSPLDDVIKELSLEGQDVETFLTLDSHPSAGQSNMAIVNGAWDFDKISREYRKYLKFMDSPPDFAKETVRRLEKWARVERDAWYEASRLDPFLPKALLPEDYLGQKAWQNRQAALSSLAKRWVLR